MSVISSRFVLFLILLLQLLLLNTGCDLYSVYNYGINNRSSDTLQFTFQNVDATYLELDTLRIPPFTDTLFFWREDDRLKEVICDPFFQEVVLVSTSSGRTLTKDINDATNWECFSENDFNDWFLEMTIEESDLE